MAITNSKDGEHLAEQRVVSYLTNVWFWGKLMCFAPFSNLAVWAVALVFGEVQGRFDYRSN
eukprot:6279263-Amphidinium_carterae.1